MTQLIGKPRLPSGVDVIAGLQRRAQFARSTAVHEPKVTAMIARPQFHDRRGFAVRADRQDDGFVRPLHGSAVFRAFESREISTRMQGVQGLRLRDFLA